MTNNGVATIARHFAGLEDPRVERTKVHPLINVLTIGLCAVICGAQHFTEMEEFGNSRKDWLSKFLDLENGVPSHDTFNAVFARLDPGAFESCLVNWVVALHEVTEGQILPIDGKTLRSSYDRAGGKAAIHMVSVWAAENQLSLGSVVVAEKSNEITAIPRLLELIDISGALVTIDAMGCQKEIAGKIVEEGGDYVLAVKENQPKLYDAVTEFFDKHMAEDFANAPHRWHATQEKGHGREERRGYFLAPVPEDFPVLDQWPGLRALGVTTTVSQREGKEAVERRYYILSRYVSGERFAAAVRGHWGIENKLHWQLDVTFREDELRIHKNHAPANMSVLMRTALSLLKNEKSVRRGMATKRLVAAWNEKYLEKVLTGQ